MESTATGRASGTAATAPDAGLIREVQIASLRRSFPFALGGSTLVACAMAYAMRGVVPVEEIRLWLGASLIASALRLIALIHYSATRSRAGSGERWLRQMTLGNLASGSLWGGAFAYWSFWVPLEYQLFFLVIQFGLGTGVIYSSYMMLAVVYAFEIPAFTPLLIALALQPTAIHLVLVLGGMAYLCALVAFVHRMHRTHLDALRLGYENLALLEQVQLEKEAAERSDREKSRFLAAASHDLRQPVHAMSLFIELLQKEELSDHGRYLVANIASATSSMGHLFEALLNISRLDAGVIQPLRQPFALDRLFGQLQAEYALQARSKGLELRMRGTDAVVDSDPVLLERILRNLLSNAIVHTDQGGVLVGCRMRGDTVRIEIWDTGPGIPPEERERVFWEFHQLHNPERDRGKGLGLGLAIVRRMAALLGHALALRSTVGRGTVFRLDVARAGSATPGAGEWGGAVTSPARTVSDEACADGRLVLVVDDDAQNRAGLELLLRSWGHRVIAGASGDELLERVVHLRERPALIVSDYRLREYETGIHVIERLREEYNDATLPAVLVSGDTDPSRLIEAEWAGIPLLHKPVPVEALRAWVNDALAERTR